MGTSTGYNAPTSPQWKEAKAQVTRAASGANGPPTLQLASNMVSNHIKANGGARAVAQGQGTIGGSAARQVAQQLGSFVSRVGSVGLNDALREAGLVSPETKSVSEITLFLIDYIGGSAAGTDDVDARNAASRLMAELMQDADKDEVEKIMEQASNDNGLSLWLERYFAYFLYSQFCRVHFERLVKKVDTAIAESFLGGILDFLRSKVRNISVHREIQRVNWKSDDGRRLAESIFEDVLIVFGG